MIAGTVRTLLVLSAIAGSTFAQGVIIPDPEGVYVDPNGVLKSRSQTTNKRLSELRKAAAKLQKDDQLCYISLPRLFAEARKTLEAGRPLPDRIRYLGGMVELKYVFVYPKEKDIVIAGPAEPFDSSVPFRPLGKYTGRPVLQLDDLVTALRTCGPGRTANAFGCTIQLTQDVVDRVRKKKKELTRLARDPKRRREMADAMAEAGGLQKVVFFGLQSDSRYAFVCAEADYHLKRFALGLDRSPVKQVKSYLAMQETPDKSHRFWFETRYDTLLVSKDGNAFELRGPSLQIKTRRSFTVDQDEKATAIARRFTSRASRHFEKLSESILPFADLANLADLALVAALIGTDKLHEKIGWDLSWVTDPKGYPAATMAVPKNALTLVNYHAGARMVIFSSGGVRLSLGEAVKNRAPDEKGTLKENSRRPDEKSWILSRKIR